MSKPLVSIPNPMVPAPARAKSIKRLKIERQRQRKQEERSRIEAADRERRAAAAKCLEEESERKSRANYSPPPSRVYGLRPCSLDYKALPSARAPSANSPTPKPIACAELTPDMLEREAAAQKEKQRKSKRIAPMYNKGGYQYIGDYVPAEIIHGLGRKL